MSNLPSIKELLARRAQTNAPASLPEHTNHQKNSLHGEEKSPSPPISVRAAESKEISEKLQEKMTALAQSASEQEATARARALGLPSIVLKGFPISPDALQLIPEEQAHELHVIAFLFTGAELRLAAQEPDDARIQELVFQLTERHKTNAKLYVASKESIAHALKLYATLPKIIPIVKGVEISEADLTDAQKNMQSVASVAALLTSANATNMMTIVVAAALKFASSDIHIEAEEGGIAVRLRIDGMLQEIARIQKEQWKKIINRIKLIASLKMNIVSEAQDGRFTIFQQQKKIDVRVSTIPTAYGESVVMRLLNPDSLSLGFEALGFRPTVLKKIIREISRPNGMIITTGPTGSGKTTTLYAILTQLNTPDVKIITLEDPIEYKLEGVNQSQIDTKKEYTFAKGLRSILRQDPDIVMVGEIRDLETAETAIQAALTGHLLLSTIHTNDAAGAIPRFLSMGVTPHLLAPAINAILGQRLVRKLCTCKKAVVPNEEITREIQTLLTTIPPAAQETVPPWEQIIWYGPGSCDTCNGTGYKGRVGVYEVLIKDAPLEQAILKSGGALSEYDMRELAKIQGMITMAQDGLLKAIDGLTSIEEIQRIVGL